jgi:uncharacterized protein DUF4157
VKRVVVQAAFGGAPPSWLTRQGVVQRAQASGGRPAAPARTVFRAPAGLLRGIGRTGRPLPTAVLRKMERFFKTDFSDVRVHVGGEASSIGALAFTTGNDIFFSPGRYQPDAPAGQALLGHELTHVVQQRAGRVVSPLASGAAVIHDEALEAEADRLGAIAATAQPKLEPRRDGGYRLIVGAYPHDVKGAPLPEQLAGHSFVAIEEPRGDRKAFGFSPAHYSDYDPRRDLGRLSAGVEGVVHDDAGAFDKQGVRTKSFPINERQARAAISKVEEYQSGRYSYNLRDRQCSTFALDVARAAHIPVAGGPPTRHPVDVLKKL